MADRLVRGVRRDYRIPYEMPEATATRLGQLRQTIAGAALGNIDPPDDSPVAFLVRLVDELIDRVEQCDFDLIGYASVNQSLNEVNRRLARAGIKFS